MLFTLTTVGWLVLRSLSTGAGGLEITLNWTAIVALGVPLVALTFLLVRFFLSVAFRHADYDTTVVKTGQKWVSQVALDGFFNILKEFWPDIRHGVLRK
jgi:hypothetical protein